MFDRTQLGRRPPGLGLSWYAGSVLYRSLGWTERTHGADDWASALDWVARVAPDRSIREIQYWGHGRWGRALIDRDALDRRALRFENPLRRRLEAVRERMTPDGLIWFRTCEAFGASAGHDFAQALGDFMGVTVAGHTYEIAFYQSGLRALSPGNRPDWPAAEGLSRGSPDAPEKSEQSRPGAPHTITCFTAQIPADYRHQSALE